MSARLRARSTARAEGLDASRALQRVLYRSAKQQPDRRFHALYDKVARSDILFGDRQVNWPHLARLRWPHRWM